VLTRGFPDYDWEEATQVIMIMVHTVWIKKRSIRVGGIALQAE